MKNNEVIGSLTSLRFFAALAIVLHHAQGLVFAGEFLPGVPLAAGVTFFFVLSGFILSYVYTDTINSVGLYKFYTARFSRIWPAHVFTMLATIALFPSPEWTLGAQNTWLVALANFFLLQSIVPVPAYYFSFNAVSWSISSELFFYCMFPLLLAKLDKNWPLKLIGLMAIGGVTVYLLDIHSVTYYAPDKLTSFSGHGLAYINPLFRIQEFFIGMLFFKLFHYVKRWQIITTASSTILEILCVFAIILLTKKFADIPFHFMSGSNSASIEFWSHCSTTLLFGFVILVFAINKGLLSKLLNIKVFVILGEISFSMYMIHQIVFRYFSSHRAAFDFLPAYAIFPALLLAVLALSYLIWILVEKPAQRGLKMFFSYVTTRRNQQLGTT